MLFACYHHTLVVIEDKLWVCGCNNFYQLGLGDRKFRENFVKVECDFDGSGIKSVTCLYESSLVLTNIGNIYVTGRYYLPDGEFYISDKFIKIDHPKNIKTVNVLSKYSSSYVLIKSNKLYLNKITFIGYKKIKIECDNIYCVNSYDQDKIIIVWTDTGLWTYDLNDNKLEKLDFDKWIYLKDLKYYNSKIYLLVESNDGFKIYTKSSNSEFINILNDHIYEDPKLLCTYSGLLIIDKKQKKIDRIKSIDNIVRFDLNLPNDEDLIDVVASYPVVFCIMRDKVYYKYLKHPNYKIDTLGLSIEINYIDISKAYIHHFLSSMPLDIFKANNKITRVKKAITFI